MVGNKRPAWVLGDSPSGIRGDILPGVRIPPSPLKLWVTGSNPIGITTGRSRRKILRPSSGVENPPLSAKGGFKSESNWDHNWNFSFSIENKKSYILLSRSSLIKLAKWFPKIRVRIKIRVVIIIRLG